MPFVPYDDLGSFTPVGAVDLARGTRWTARMLATNGEAGEQWFRNLGYETQRWGPGWQWKYRKANSGGPWNPANPRGLDLGDILSFATDALMGFGAGAAATLSAGAAAPSGPGAVLAGMAGGGAAMAGLEAGREAIGSAVGIPNNISPGNIEAAGVGGALATPVSMAVGAAGRLAMKGVTKALGTVGGLTPEIAAKFTGIKALGTGPGGATAGQTMMEGVRLTRGGKIPLGTPERAAILLRNALQVITNNRIPQVRLADEMIANANAAGLTADLTAPLESLQNRTLQQVGTKAVSSTKKVVTETLASGTREARAAGSRFSFKPTGEIEETPFDRGVRVGTTGLGGEGTTARTTRQAATTRTVEEPVYAPASTDQLAVERASAPEMPKDAADLLDRLERLGINGNWSNVPIQVVHNATRVLQNEARGAGAYAAAAKSEMYRNMVRTLAAQVRGIRATAMEPVHPGFTALMKEAEDLANQFDGWREALAMGSNKFQDVQRAVNTVLGMYGRRNTAGLKALNDLAHQFYGGETGRLLEEARVAVRQSNIGERIGNRGLGEPVPIFSAYGRPRSVAALGMVAGSVMTGHPAAALAGAALGTPRVMMKMAGPVAAGFNTVTRLAENLSRTQLGSLARVVSQGVLTTAQVAALRQVINTEGGGSKALARQDARPKSGRRLTFIGQ